MMVMVVVFVVKMVFTMMVMGTSVHGRAAAAHFVVVYGCGRAPRTTWYQKGVAARSSNLVSGVAARSSKLVCVVRGLA